MKSVFVQWDIFIAHMLRGKGGGSGEERILSLSFVLPPSEDYRYWRFSGASTEDEPLTHTGSCDTRKAQSDGGKNKQLGLDFLFLLLFLKPFSSSSRCSSPFLFVLCHRQHVVQQCHLWCAERHFTLSQLPIWVCVWLRMFTFERKFSSCLRLCQRKVNLFSSSFSASRFPSCQSSINVELPRLCQNLFFFFSPASLKFCLLFYGIWLTTVHRGA